MPELPEVETIRRDLAGEVEGRTLRATRVHQPDILMNLPSPAAFRREVTGRSVRALDRRAKYLLFRLDDGRVLQVQLRMTGRFALGRARPDPGEYGHVAAELELDDGRTLWYDDVRRLGGFRLLAAAEWERESRRLGPEPLSDGWEAGDLAAALSGRRAPVKNLLLDQELVAGVGNIYASEALHEARLDPRRAGGDLDPEEIARLHGAVRSVLRDALAHAGTTFRDYRAVDGRTGSFQERLAVYGRDGDPCRACGAGIRRDVLAGRSTFRCPACQS